MSQVKFSLKTNKFTKRKHQIFEKKQSMESLHVHEPPPTSNVDLQYTKQNEFFQPFRHRSQSSASSFHYPAHDLTSFLANKNRKPDEEFHQYVSIEGIKSARIEGELPSMQKKQFFPQSPPRQQKISTEWQDRQSQDMSRVECSSESMSELIWIRLLLLQNEERIHEISDSFNRISQNTAQLYEEHAKKLNQMVSKRCGEFCEIFRKIVLFLKGKTEKTEDLDQRFSLFYNTLKQTKQNIRVLSIKQECIELQLNSKSKKAIPNSKIVERRAEKYVSPVNKNTSFDFIQEFVEKKIELDKKNKNHQPFFESQWNFTYESKYDSPQQASQLDSQMSCQIKSPLHQYIRRQDQHSKIKQNCEYTFQSMGGAKQRRQKYEDLINKVGQSTRERVKLWRDDLSCLRTQIGGYLLDENGNAIICSIENYHRLLEDGIILAMQ